MSRNKPAKKKRTALTPEERLTPSFIRACAKLLMTQEEIGDLLGCTQGYVSRRLNEEPELLAAWRQGKAQTHRSLRRIQLEKATQDKNMLALIWLGKQELGQSDHNEPTPPPITVNIQYAAVWGKTLDQLPSPPELAIPFSLSAPPVSDDTSTIDGTCTDEDDRQ